MNGSAPMAGVRVLDLTHFVAGPWCTMLLADLGADVVKVEPVASGEISRTMGSVYDQDDSAIFLGFNRGKRSLALDLKTDAGRAVLHRLAERSDVVVQNFRPSIAARLGVDAATLAAVNPRLVWCGITAFGESGPSADEPGNDPLIQGVSGAMTQSLPGPPLRLGVSVPDFAGGVLSAIGILATLWRRRSTGQGSNLRLNLLDTQLYAMADRLETRPTAGRAPEAGRALRCRDGWLWVAEPDKLLDTLGRPAHGDPDVALTDMTLKECRSHAERHHLVVAPVAALGEVLPGTPARTVTLPRNGRPPVRMVRTPLRFDPPLPEPQRPPPRLGEHTTEVLRQLGYDDESISRLHANGVVGGSQE